MPWAVAIPAIAAVVGGGISAWASNKSSNAATDATNTQVAAGQRAAELEARSAADSLGFLREQEAARQDEWRSTQAKNYEQWLSEQNYTRGQDKQDLEYKRERDALQQSNWAAIQRRNAELEAARQGRLKPYQNLGAGSLGQMARPIPTLAGQGSLASMVGR
jgi:hypothetical protein